MLHDPRSCWASEERVYLLLMCDNDSFDDMAAYRVRRELFSRRGFGSLSLGAGLASLLPIGCKSTEPAPGTVPASAAASGAAITPTASAVMTTESEVTITTPDGACDAYFVHSTSATAPAVLVWPDTSGSVRRSVRWGSGSPNRDTPCS